MFLSTSFFLLGSALKFIFPFTVVWRWCISFLPVVTLNFSMYYTQLEVYRSLCLSPRRLYDLRALQHHSAVSCSSSSVLGFNSCFQLLWQRQPVVGQIHLLFVFGDHYFSLPFLSDFGFLLPGVYPRWYFLWESVSDGLLQALPKKIKYLFSASLLIGSASYRTLNCGLLPLYILITCSRCLLALLELVSNRAPCFVV